MITTSEIQQIGAFERVSSDYHADFFGIPVADFSLGDLVKTIEHELVQKRSTHVVNLNPHHFLISHRDGDFRQICRTGDMVFADGIGIVFASFLQQRRIHNRYTGLDVMVRLCALSAEKSYSVFLFGGQDGIVDQCAAHLRKFFPSLKIVGTLEPPLADNIKDFDNEAIVRTANESRADMLFVALGAPKQEKWIETFRHSLTVPIMMGVGGSFDILGGRFSRAPRWMRALGLEWLHRLKAEPRRLAGRYLLGIPRFIMLVVWLKVLSTTNRSPQ